MVVITNVRDIWDSVRETAAAFAAELWLAIKLPWVWLRKKKYPIGQCARDRERE
jgi:hypothetical protein